MSEGRCEGETYRELVSEGADRELMNKGRSEGETGS